MWKQQVTLLLLLCVSAQSAQKVIESNPKPYDPDFGIGYSIEEPNFVYGQDFPSLESIDFRNSVVHVFEANGKHLVCGKLHGGYWEGVENNGLNIDTLRWRGHRLLRSANSDVTDILVWFDHWGAGGSSDLDGYAQVWRLKNGKLTVVQQIQFNLHFGADLPGRQFDAERQTLTVLASHYLPGDAHCCISAFDELTFQWDGNRFELVKKETKSNPH